ncbi:MAG: DUF1801 domain-containing protein [Dehalococcoidia bacterium]
MAPTSPDPAAVDAYITGLPPAVRARLETIRATIRRAVPDATEVISYQMPAFRLRTTFIFYAGYEHHTSLYPAPFGVEEFAADLARYGSGKGTLRFPHDEPLPLDLIERVTKYRAQEQEAPRPRPRRRAST